jgi:hypothetical protein
MGDQTQAYDIFQTPLSSGYPLPLKRNTTVNAFSSSIPLNVLSYGNFFEAHFYSHILHVYCTIYKEQKKKKN